MTEDAKELARKVLELKGTLQEKQQIIKERNYTIERLRKIVEDLESKVNLYNQRPSVVPPIWPLAEV